MDGNDEMMSASQPCSWTSGTSGESDFVYHEFSCADEVLFDLRVSEDREKIVCGFWNGGKRVEVVSDCFVRGMEEAIKTLTGDIKTGYSGADISNIE